MGCLQASLANQKLHRMTNVSKSKKKPLNQMAMLAELQRLNKDQQITKKSTRKKKRHNVGTKMIVLTNQRRMKTRIRKVGRIKRTTITMLLTAMPTSVYQSNPKEMTITTTRLLTLLRLEIKKLHQL